MNKVFSLVRKMYGYSPNDEMKEIYVNGALWVCLCPLLFELQSLLGKLYSEFDNYQVSFGEIIETVVYNDSRSGYPTTRNFYGYND